ncbi:MAG: Rieske 2Fe-2S domain-containing protein [Solirubrobacteraceae bacterium]
MTAPESVASRVAAAGTPGVTADPVAAGYIAVGAVDDVPMLEGRRVTVDGRRIAVFRLPAGFAAVDADCPHAGGPLHDGLVADGCVTCPLHNWRIDLGDGTVAGQDAQVAVHDVVEHGGRIFVRLGADRAVAGDGGHRAADGAAA